jgi:hypothetical protein
MTIDPEIKGSNLAVIQHQENIAEEKDSWALAVEQWQIT